MLHKTLLCWQKNGTLIKEEKLGLQIGHKKAPTSQKIVVGRHEKSLNPSTDRFFGV